MKDSVFRISILINILIVAWAIVFNHNFTTVSDALFSLMTTNFSWLYLLAMLVFVIFAIGIAISKYGNIKLGPDDSVPAYNTVSWFAMLFGCGMGVGLVFWGISEPVSHLISPVAGVAPGTPEAAAFAFKSSFMHWGIHPWANYSIIGLALGYFQFRKNKPGLISVTLEPVFGARLMQGGLGKAVDCLAVFATVAGVVTSLGLGVLQINSGLHQLFGIPSNLTIQIGIIAVISLVYIGTAVAGIEKGIKRVSDLNLFLAVILLIVCFLVGPTLEILNNLIGGAGNYIQSFLSDSLLIAGYGDVSWTIGWRVFYWAWWIAWAPFVGMFIARISRGRTIREFIVGVVFVPSVASILWFAVFGSLGVSLGIHNKLSELDLIHIAGNPEEGLFMVLNHYPAGMILSILCIVLLCTFFITSANSGTYVLSTMTSDGMLNPPRSKMLLWGLVQSAMSIGMLMAGGLKPLQTVSIVAAFPFLFIMLAIMISLLKVLRDDHSKTP